MEDQHGRVETISVKFEWTICNVSKLNCKKLYSDTFFTGNHPWRLYTYPEELKYYARICLDCGEAAANFPDGWSRCANLKFSLINNVNAKMTRTNRETGYRFCAGRTSYDFGFVICTAPSSIDEFFVEDKCVIVAEVSVVNSRHDEDTIGNPSPKLMPSSSNADYELMDFKGLCKIEKGFVHLLEQVCSKHPTLIESHRKRKRTHKFNEWSFTALGRVLHFLKTKKVKDMNEDTCNELQNLWEELETVRFDDLAWLEPHVQSALGMKNYMERASKLKRLKGDMADLQAEIKSLKEQLFAAEENLEIITKDLVRSHVNFEERNLDDALGYGMSQLADIA